MPKNHRDYTQWNAERFIRWAAGIGSNTEAVVRAILASRKVEEQGYKACIALLKLADRFSVLRLEEACKRALYYTTTPSFKSVHTILKTGSDKTASASELQPSDTSSDFGFTRGARYYGRND
jgi:hypothetical protein